MVGSQNKFYEDHKGPNNNDPDSHIKKKICRDFYFYFLKSLEAFGPPLDFVKRARKH